MSTFTREARNLDARLARFLADFAWEKGELKSLYRNRPRAQFSSIGMRAIAAALRDSGIIQKLPGTFHRFLD